MKIHRDCGLSFKVWWVLTFVFESLSSGVITGIAVCAFFSKVGSKFQLAYFPSATTNYLIKNATFEVVVTSWILVLLVSLCVLRFLVAVMLVIGIKRSSAEMAKVWIAFKVFSVMMSAFLITASFNVSLIVKTASLVSFVTDLVSSYFVRILYPELDRMRKFIVHEVDPVEPSKN